MTREARLKDQYRVIYPWLRTGVWQPAAGVVDRLLADLLEHPGALGAMRHGRLLEPEHFEFRGDSACPRPRRMCHTRRPEW